MMRTPSIPNPAYEDGDLNPMVYLHQGIILSEFVEHGGNGLRAGLFKFAREVSEHTFKRSMSYDFKNTERFVHDIIEMFERIGVRLSVNHHEQIMEDSQVIDYWVERMNITKIVDGLTDDVRMSAIAYVSSKSVDLSTWMLHMTANHHKILHECIRRLGDMGIDPQTEL